MNVMDYPARRAQACNQLAVPDSHCRKDLSVEIGIGSAGDELGIKKGSAEPRSLEEDLEVRKSTHAEGIAEILHLIFGGEKSSRGARGIGVGSRKDDDISGVARVWQVSDYGVLGKVA